jgi:hypothetical protein
MSTALLRLQIHSSFQANIVRSAMKRELTYTSGARQTLKQMRQQLLLVSVPQTTAEESCFLRGPLCNKETPRGKRCFLHGLCGGYVTRSTCGYEIVFIEIVQWRRVGGCCERWPPAWQSGQCESRAELSPETAVRGAGSWL